ncbi:hypothetical protein BD410DRAFT_903300 [Rickenella mellea]|uniref:BTB domain-containing protein n=1 Tax=Rickenella mellea TaxID=50990 RepID=A0A4Y7PDY0_9AGAM|nr:hypothetical protein BD410DRAFT_903302 [Rickenella mellea]TDL13446.1 hypothetical protein BD410DRAFT_903300 [Rickenella mellea]
MASTSTPSNSITTRHETLYLPAGDLVLSALSDLKDRGLVLFRVHKFMMAHHSSIFRDMFALPIPVEDFNESYDGASMVHIPDSAEDLEGLLRVLYDPTRLPHKCQEFDFAVVGLLKLAIKYEIEPIRKHIVTRVNAAWPSSLEEWDAVDKRSASMEESGVTSTDALLPEPVLCIEIARLVPQDVHISPVAFYQLSRTSPNDNWDQAGTGKHAFRCALWNNLCYSDYLQLLRGQETVRNCLTEVEKEMRFPASSCQSISSCLSAYDKIWQETYCEVYKHSDPLLTLLMMDRPGYKLPDNLCEDCFSEFYGMLGGLRNGIWKAWSRAFALTGPN